MAQAKPPKKHYASAEEALLDTGMPIQYCHNDKGFLKKDGACGAGAFCYYEKGGKCTKHTPADTGIVKKVVEASPFEETKGDLPAVKSPVREISSLMPKVVLDKPEPTPEDCSNGGKQYYKQTVEGGVCIAKTCPYQTKYTVEITVRKGGADEKKALPICIAHSIDGCLVDGNKSLFHEGANGCIAAGIAECPEQSADNTVSMGDTVVCFCKKYSV